MEEECLICGNICFNEDNDIVKIAYEIYPEYKKEEFKFNKLLGYYRDAFYHEKLDEIIKIMNLKPRMTPCVFCRIQIATFALKEIRIENGKKNK